MFRLMHYNGSVVPNGSQLGPFTPYDPTTNTNLKIWWDFSNTTSLSTSGSQITAIQDLTTNSNTGTPSLLGGSNTGPTYIAAVQNALAAGSFSSTHGLGIFKSGLFTPGNVIGSGMAFLAVGQIKGLTNLYAPLLYEAAPSGGEAFAVSENITTTNTISGTNTTSYLQYAPVAIGFGGTRSSLGTTTVGTNTYTGTGTATGSWVLFTQIYNRVNGSATGSGLYQENGGANNAINGTWTNGNVQSAPYQFAVGCSNGGLFNSWAGFIGEVLAYNTNISQAEYQKVEGYLAWKWGIQGQLPGGHPYKNSAPTG